MQLAETFILYLVATACVAMAIPLLMTWIVDERQKYIDDHRGE